MTRYIPINIKRRIEEKHGRKCAFPKCNKPAVALHHTRRFAYSKNHDPEKIVPLCKKHHELAHYGEIKNEGEIAEKWQLRKLEDGLQFTADKKWEKERGDLWHGTGAGGSG